MPLPMSVTLMRSKIKKGTTKNTTSHAYGRPMTKRRPGRQPNRESCFMAALYCVSTTGADASHQKNTGSSQVMSLPPWRKALVAVILTRRPPGISTINVL